MRKLYDFNQEADTYDAYYESEYGKQIDVVEKAAILPFVKDVAPSRMLDLGCGTGHWTSWLADLGCEVQGVDIADKMIQIAREKDIPKANFIIADMMKLPYKDNSWNHVFSVAAFSFTKDPSIAINEAFRVLKPGGKLIAAVLNRDSIIGKIQSSNLTFSSAQFFTNDAFKLLIQNLGEFEISYAAYISKDFEVLDGNCQRIKEERVQPAMMVACVSKLS